MLYMFGRRTKVPWYFQTYFLLLLCAAIFFSLLSGRILKLRLSPFILGISLCVSQEMEADEHYTDEVKSSFFGLGVGWID